MSYSVFDSFSPLVKFIMAGPLLIQHQEQEDAMFGPLWGEHGITSPIYPPPISVHSFVGYFVSATTRLAAAIQSTNTAWRVKLVSLYTRPY